MWISYAGKDSSQLVEALVSEIKTLCPTLEVKRYKKRVSVQDKLSAEDQSEAGHRADDEWPVIERRQSDQKEQFYLLPMEQLFELVVEIAYSPRVLVILSPAYFNSLPCLQELAALISLECRPIPLFVLNGLTHEDIGQCEIKIHDKKSNDEKILDLSEELVKVRKRALELDKLQFFMRLTSADVKNYFEKLVKSNVPAVSGQAHASNEQTDPSSIASTVMTANGDLKDAASSITENLKAHFVDRAGIATYHQGLQKSDYQRFERWFETRFGKMLHDKIIEHAASSMTARQLVERLMNDPYDVHVSVVESLDIMQEIRAEAKPDALGMFKDNDKWNIAISELAGLYTLTLIDYDVMANLWREGEMGNLMFVSFSTGEFQANFQACVINASIQESMLRVRPVRKDSASGAPEVPEFHLSEKPKSAAEDNKQFAREFVESLYAHVTGRLASSCPQNDPGHATGMDEAERRRLRGQIKGFQKRHGHGSIVLTINRSKFTTENNWWDSWDAMHEALNDGATLHASVRLRGIIIRQHNDSAVIKMHPDYEERLVCVTEILEKHYLQ